MQRLEAASDVVCLLTRNSVGRPWILYEAGVAKGKWDTPVHGVALGLPMQTAITGPFAQFQNSDDSEDALTTLVMQLIKRIPGSDPNREMVKTQVVLFRNNALPMATADDAQVASTTETDATSVAKIFEEIKVMFQDLPGRVERRLDPEYGTFSKRRRRFQPDMVFEALHFGGREMPEGLQLVIVSSLFRDDFPWLYEMATDAYRKMSAKDVGAFDALVAFEHVFHTTFRNPAFRDLIGRSKERFMEVDMARSIISETIDRLRHEIASRNPRTLEDTRKPEAQN